MAPLACTAETNVDRRLNCLAAATKAATGDAEAKAGAPSTTKAYPLPELLVTGVKKETKTETEGEEKAAGTDLHQKWRYEDGYIISQQTGHVLDVEGGNCSNFAHVKTAINDPSGFAPLS